jgi:hypothetical protein
VQISKKRMMSAGSRFLIQGYVAPSASVVVVGAVPVSSTFFFACRCNGWVRGHGHTLGRYMRYVRGVVYQLEPKFVWERCHLSWVRFHIIRSQ